SLEQLEKKKQSMAAVGKLAAFYMEYMSILNDASTAKFTQIVHGEPKWDEVTGIALAVDPAISAKVVADFFAIVVLCMTQGGTIYVLDIFLKQSVLPREQVDMIFSLFSKWMTRLLGLTSRVGI